MFPAASLLWQSWKWKSINNGVSVVAAGAPFSYLCWLFFEKRPKRGRERKREGTELWLSAAICCFTFQIMSCDRANGLLQSAKQYAEPCRSVSPAKCQNVTERFIAGQVEKVASPFFRECISHAMICVLTLINHPLQHYSPWRLTPPGSFSPPPTHDAWRWIGFQHREKSVRNPEMSCGWERIHWFFYSFQYYKIANLNCFYQLLSTCINVQKILVWKYAFSLADGWSGENTNEQNVYFTIKWDIFCPSTTTETIAISTHTRNFWC